MISEGRVKARLQDTLRSIDEINKGNGTLLERSYKDLLITLLNKEVKLLKWILEIKE